MFIKHCIFLASISFFSICFGQDFIVDTTIGLVRGYPAEDGDYINYLGIPYGKVNENTPFGAATPHPPFEDVFEAIDDSAICPQQEEFNNTIVGTLDCLHLNIHVPSSAGPNNLLPVFVWIYGGGFTLGFYGRFLYGPKYLTRHDIIFISLNYRLGPYGFMALGTPEVPGNQGLKDQVMALRWIKDNIAAFGGDPDKITIGGNSAGSTSVDFHVLRKNNGPPLFNQAVLQSGNTYMTSPGISNTLAPLLMAQHLGLVSFDVEEAVAFLAEQDPHDVIAISVALNIGYFTVIEREFEGVEPFITENWFNMQQIPNVKDMPVLVGFNNNEAALAGSALPAEPTILRVVMTMFFDMSHPDFESMNKNVENFYLGGGENNNSNQLVDFLGDIVFIYSTHRSVKRFLEKEVGNLYLYQFSYGGGRNFVQHRENLTHEGAGHADELGYLFDISYMEEPTSEDQSVIDSMTALWANFVKYGDPTPETSPLLPHKWEAISSDSPYHYMDIDLELSVGTRLLHERMAFWDLLYDGYGHLEIAIKAGEARWLVKQLTNLSRQWKNNLKTPFENKYNDSV